MEAGRTWDGSGGRQVGGGHDVVGGELAGGEEAEGFELADLVGEALGGDLADLAGVGGIAADDEAGFDDHAAGEGEEFVGVGGVGGLDEGVGGGGVVVEVGVPAADVGVEEAAEGVGVLVGPVAVGDEDGVGVEAGVPGEEVTGFFGSALHDVVGFGDGVALLDEVGVGDEVGDGEVERDDVEGDVVFALDEVEERPAGAGHDGAAVEVGEVAHGAVGVEEEGGRVVLENGGDVEEGEVAGDGGEGGGAVGLGEVGAAGGELGEDGGAGAAGDEFDLEAGFVKVAEGEGLVEAAVLGFGEPVELDHDAGGAVAGLGGVGRTTGDKEEGECQGQEELKNPGRGARQAG